MVCVDADDDDAFWCRTKDSEDVASCRASIWQIMISSFEYEGERGTRSSPADGFSILIHEDFQLGSSEEGMERDETRQIFKVEFFLKYFMFKMWMFLL